jgi:peptidyl-prolyl cis-trans isomerase B (cyclophilin B)
MSKKRQKEIRRAQVEQVREVQASKNRRYYAFFSLLGLIVVACVIFVVIIFNDTNTVPDIKSTDSETTEPAPIDPTEEVTPTDETVVDENVPPSTLAQNKSGTLTLELTQGAVEIELFGALAPQAVSSMIYLAETDWYSLNNAACTRVTTAVTFKILQCGGPNGDQAGGPGYNYGPIENAPEPFERDGALWGSYTKGMVAMARVGGDANSMGSQFFIMYGDTEIPEDQVGGYSVIGEVKKGLDIIEKIAAAGTADGAEDGAPKEPVNIVKATVSGWDPIEQEDPQGQ